MSDHSDKGDPASSAADHRDAEAAGWITRLDQGPLSAQDQARFQAWLAEDVRQHGAYVRATAAWTRLNQSAPAELSRFSRRRSLFAIGGAVAAALPLYYGARMALEIAGERTYESATGEIINLALAPGVAVKLDAQSRLRARLDGARVRIVLDAGRAWFDVASTPLLLKAAHVEVQGGVASFGAVRSAERLSLLVARGNLIIKAAADREFVAAPMTKVSFAGGRYVDSVPVDQGAIDQANAWTAGRLIFDGETVAEAAAAFNRYNRVKIKVVGQMVAQRHVVGYFRLNNPKIFCLAAANAFGARVTVREDVLILDDPAYSA
jgi:transmembrane sensor